MMASPKTVRISQIDFYASHAEEYCRSTVCLDMKAVYEQFLNSLSAGSHILDAGCGSGRDTKAFLDRGFLVSAFDASPEMALFASKYTGQTCRVLRFQQLEFHEEFDGIWACASFLHVPKHEMKGVIRRLSRALKPGGLMYASFIESEDERISNDGRLYNCYTVESFSRRVGKIPALVRMGSWKSAEISPSRERAPWLNLLFKRISPAG